jgi:hypothetical protein
LKDQKYLEKKLFVTALTGYHYGVFSLEWPIKLLLEYSSEPSEITEALTDSKEFFIRKFSREQPLEEIDAEDISLRSDAVIQNFVTKLEEASPETWDKIEEFWKK